MKSNQDGTTQTGMEGAMLFYILDLRVVREALSDQTTFGATFEHRSE